MITITIILNLGFDKYYSMIRKKTKQKSAILRSLWGTNSHPTADWIYNEVRKEIPNVSLGTVYRNLRLLKNEGEILELEFAGHLSRYDGNTTPHYHFRCVKCGRVIDLDNSVNETLNTSTSKKTGLQILYHIIEFRGHCRDCAELSGRTHPG